MIRVHRLFSLIVFFCLVTSVLPTFAQKSDGVIKERAPREKVEFLIQMRLSQALQLNSQQIEQLAALMKKFQERRWQLKRQARALTQELSEAVNSGNESAMKSTISKLEKIKNEMDRLDQERFDEARQFLTIQQQAKFLLVMDEIRREIRSIKNMSN